MLSERSPLSDRCGTYTGVGNVVRKVYQLSLHRGVSFNRPGVIGLSEI